MSPTGRNPSRAGPSRRRRRNDPGPSSAPTRGPRTGPWSPSAPESDAEGLQGPVRGPRVGAELGPGSLRLRRRLGPARLGYPTSRRTLPAVPLFRGRFGRRDRVLVLFLVHVADHRNLAGQLGDRDGVAVAAATATAPGDRGGANGPIPGQQFGHRDRPGAGSSRSRSVVRSFVAFRSVAVPIHRLASSIAHGSLHEGSSVGFAVEFAQDETFP